MGHILSLCVYCLLCMEYLFFFPTSKGFKFYFLCEAFLEYLFDYVSCVYVYPVSLPHWLWGDRINCFGIFFFCGPEPGSQWALTKELNEDDSQVRGWELLGQDTLSPRA